MRVPEIEIAVKYKTGIRNEVSRITNSAEMATVVKSLFDVNQIDWVEEFILLCLNQRNTVIGYYKVSKGCVTQTLVDIRVIATVALNAAGCTKIVVAHNHPSGNCTPSSADDAATRKIKDAMALLDITLLDHMIMTSDNGYYSYADMGRII